MYSYTKLSHKNLFNISIGILLWKLSQHTATKQNSSTTKDIRLSQACFFILSHFIIINITNSQTKKEIFIVSKTLSQDHKLEINQSKRVLHRLESIISSSSDQSQSNNDWDLDEKKKIDLSETTSSTLMSNAPEVRASTRRDETRRSLDLCDHLQMTLTGRPSFSE